MDFWLTVILIIKCIKCIPANQSIFAVFTKLSENINFSVNYEVMDFHDLVMGKSWNFIVL